MSLSPTEALARPLSDRLIERLRRLASSLTWVSLRSRWAAPQTLYLSEDGLLGPDGSRVEGAPEAAFGAWCAAHPSARARVVLASSAVRCLVAAPDLPLADEAALLAYARLQFSHYFGPSSPHWPLAAWWVGSQRGVCALADDGFSLAALRAAARDVHLQSLRPSWCDALLRAAQQDPTWAAAEHTALAWVEDRSLTWLTLQAGRVVDIQQRLLDPQADSALGAAELQTLLHGLQADNEPCTHAPQLLGWSRWLTAPGIVANPQSSGLFASTRHPARAWPEPDFVRAPQRAGLLMWGWLLAAGVGCTLALSQWQDQRDEARRLTEQVELLARLDAPPTAARSNTPGAVKAPPLNGAARTRAWAVNEQLTAPWEDQWLELEHALPVGLQLTGLDLTAGNLRLEGLATEPDAVMQLVDRLAMRARERSGSSAGSSPGGAEQEVVLTRLQRPERAEAANQLRFEIVRRPATRSAGRSS